MLGQLLSFCGIDADRLRTRWVSSAEAPEFVEELEKFIDTLRELGPSPLRKRMGEKEAA